MVLWVVLGVLVFALLLLVLVTLPVLSGLGRLGRAAARTERELAGAQTLQMSLAHLEERIAAFQDQTTGVQEHLAARRRSTAR